MHGIIRVLLYTWTGCGPFWHVISIKANALFSLKENSLAFLVISVNFPNMVMHISKKVVLAYRFKINNQPEKLDEDKCLQPIKYPQV